MFDDKTRAAVFESLLRSIESQEKLELGDLSMLKAVYNNSAQAERTPSMSDRSYKGRQEAFTPVSYCALLVNKVASLLYGRTVQRSAGFADEVMNAKVDLAYKNTGGLFMRLGKLSSLAGYSAVRVKRDWTGEYVLRVYGFDEVKPILDPENPFGMVKGLLYDIQTTALPPWVHELNPTLKKESLYRFQEVITRNDRDSNGNIIAPGSYEVRVDGKKMQTRFGDVNPLGDYLGAVWWRGMDDPFNPWGGSDILGLLKTLTALNETMTDGRELILWNLHSPVVTNVKSALNWKYGPRAVWQAMGGETGEVWVKRLESGTGSFDSLEKFIRLIIDMTHQTSRIPLVSVGNQEGLGQASSGRAFEIAMTPAKELIAEKENAAIPQEELLMEEIVARMAYYGDLPGGTYRYDQYDMPDMVAIRKMMVESSISFTPLVFPQGVMEETLTGQVAGGLRSRRDAIRYLHPAWPDPRIDEELEAIDEERKAQEDEVEAKNLAALKERVEANLKNQSTEEKEIFGT
jgi:hypothetical protein